MAVALGEALAGALAVALVEEVLETTRAPSAKAPLLVEAEVVQPKHQAFLLLPTPPFLSSQEASTKAQAEEVLEATHAPSAKAPLLVEVEVVSLEALI